MHKLTILFLVLIALLQYPLWLGKGSWLRVWHISQQVEQQKKINEDYKKRNETLRAEVRDLKQGQSAVEERARSELGMIKDGETFYQVIELNQPVEASSSQSPAQSTASKK